MRVISKTRLVEFWSKHSRAKAPLELWYQLISKGSFLDFNALKQTFGASVDYVSSKYVFDIGGNKYRLIVAIHFDKQRVYVRHVLTHKEYDLGAWK